MYGEVREVTVQYKDSRESATYDIVDLTGGDLCKLIQAAFDISRPQGMGFLHYSPDHVITDEEAKEMVTDANIGVHLTGSHVALNLDYVRGRAVKLTVFLATEEQRKHNLIARALPAEWTHWAYADWYDHSREQMEQIVEAAKPAE